MDIREEIRVEMIKGLTRELNELRAVITDSLNKNLLYTASVNLEVMIAKSDKLNELQQKKY